VDIDPPTITMKICINDGPLAGREGNLLTARQVRERLFREVRTNVSLQVADTDTAGHFEIKARGEMQIAILVEQMRREGSRGARLAPRGHFQARRQRQSHRAVQELSVDLPQNISATSMQSLASRKAEITHMEHHPHSVELTAIIPTRGLIGFETVLVNTTKGLGIISALFHGYGPHKGEIPNRGTGCS